jgi:uncharacterized protein YuzE
MSLSVSYDRAVDAAYIRFSSEPIEESEEVSPGIVLDYDAEGRNVGMEVMKAQTHLSPDLLDQAA